HLTKAADSYTRIKQTATSGQLEIKLRALLGLASAEESLRSLDKAREALEDAKKASPNSVMGKEADRRLAMLDSHKDWYEWFKENPPVSPHDIMGKGDKSLGDPFKLKDLPDNPDIKFSTPPSNTAPIDKSGDKPAGPEKPESKPETNSDTP